VRIDPLNGGALPSGDKQAFIVEIMRRARELPFDSGLIADEEIGEPGKAVFAPLDQEEKAARAAMRGEFELPEDWD
jgi:hypothetical protein